MSKEGNAKGDGGNVPWYERRGYDVMYPPFPEESVKLTSSERIASLLLVATMVVVVVITSVRALMPSAPHGQTRAGAGTAGAAGAVSFA